MSLASIYVSSKNLWKLASCPKKVFVEAISCSANWATGANVAPEIPPPIILLALLVKNPKFLNLGNNNPPPANAIPEPVSNPANCVFISSFANIPP